jgi:hypothetical protein
MSMFDKTDAARAMAAEAEELSTRTDAADAAADGTADTETTAVPAGEATLPASEPATQATGPDSGGEPSEDGEDGRRSVPFRALKAERQKRQQVEREFHTLQGQVQAWQNAMLAQLQGASADGQANRPPSVDEDPVGALRYTQQQLSDLQSAVASQIQSQHIQSAYVAGANAFSRANPDFADAYRHMIESRANELRVLGAPDQAIAQQLRLEEQQMVAAALRAGRNPAEIAYAAAKARGWQPRAGNGGVPAARTTNAAPPGARATAAIALSPGGRANREAVSAEDVSRMSGRDFDAGWEKLFGKRTGGLFSGR